MVAHPLVCAFWKAYFCATLTIGAFLDILRSFFICLSILHGAPFPFVCTFVHFVLLCLFVLSVLCSLCSCFVSFPSLCCFSVCAFLASTPPFFFPYCSFLAFRSRTCFPFLYPPCSFYNAFSTGMFWVSSSSVHICRLGSGLRTSNMSTCRVWSFSAV